MSARVSAVVFDMFETLVTNDPSEWIAVFKDIIRDQHLNTTETALWAAWRKPETTFRDARLNMKDFSKNPPFKTYTAVWTDSFVLAFNELGVKADVASAVEACLEALRNRGTYPDTHPGLNALRGRYHLGLVSNADDSYLDGAVAHNKLKFEVVVSSEAVQTYKPDPRLFHTALKKMNVTPIECVYVGDRQFEDVLGARLAGMHSVWLNRLNTPLKSDLPKPDMTITSLTELPKAITVIERAAAR